MAQQGRTRILPSSVSDPVHAGDKRIFRIGLYGIGGLFALCLLVYAGAASHHGSTSTQLDSVGTVVTTATHICSGRAKIDVIPAKELLVSENDSCPFHFGIVNGVVELNGPTGRRVVRPGQEQLVPRTFIIRTARAIEGSPMMSHTSCDPQKERTYDGQNCT